VEAPDTEAPTTKAQKTKRVNAVKKYKKATADAKRAQTTLTTVQAACITTGKDVVLAQTSTKKAARAKLRADRAHSAVVVQLDLLVQAAGDTKRQLADAGQRKAGKLEMNKLTTAEANAVADYKAYQTTVKSSARNK
jgi:hypothetical protein